MGKKRIKILYVQAQIPQDECDNYVWITYTNLKNQTEMLKLKNTMNEMKNATKISTVEFNEHRLCENIVIGGSMYQARKDSVTNQLRFLPSVNDIPTPGLFSALGNRGNNRLT